MNCAIVIIILACLPNLFLDKITQPNIESEFEMSPLISGKSFYVFVEILTY